MSSNDTASILSRLFVTRSGDLAYDAGGVTFTADPLDIYEAHAVLAVGAHPYAAISLSYSGDSAANFDADLTPCEAYDLAISETDDDCDPESVIADWMDWCDAVAEEVTAHFDDEPTPTFDAADVIAAMRVTWAVDAEAAERVLQVNAAA